MPTYTNQPDDTSANDCYINQYQPGTSFNSTKLWCGYPIVLSMHTACRILIKDPFTGIPADATIISAKLEITVTDDDSNNERTGRAYRVRRNWTESATWNKYDGTNDWGTAGCTGAGDRETTEIGTWTQAASPSGGTVYTINLTASKVQEWINGTMTNYGLLLKVDTESDDGVGYASSGYATSSYRPKWTVEYVLGGGEPVQIAPYLVL